VSAFVSFMGDSKEHGFSNRAARIQIIIGLCLVSNLATDNYCISFLPQCYFITHQGLDERGLNPKP
jgi:hypothetical protein